MLTNPVAATWKHGVAVALMVMVAMSVGCSSRLNRIGTQYYDPGAQASLDETGTATQPITADTFLPSAAPPRLSVDDEARIAHAVHDARDHLLNANAQAAAGLLSDAQYISGWAQSVHGPDILFWLGHAHEQLNEPVAAMSAYRRLVTLFPESPLARRARRRLREIEAEIR